jgi:hypothetical protein
LDALVLKSRWNEHRETFADEELAILNRNVSGQQLGPPGLFVKVTPETRPLLERMEIELPAETDDEPNSQAANV